MSTQTTTSPEQSVALGARLSANLRAGDTVCLRGELGAGKTQFVKGIAQGLGIDPSRVTSPTFVIVHVYERDGGPDLVHIDAYRLGDLDELADLGWDRIFDGTNIVAIEWPQRIEGGIPPGAFTVSLEHAGETQRTIEIDAPRQIELDPADTTRV